MDIKMLFAKRLKEARLDKGLTQNRLAEISGVHEKAILRYEKGSIMATADNIARLASALEISTDYLLLPHARREGVPNIHDPELFERYFILETLEERERTGLITILDSLIARKKLKELAKSHTS
jgi:transcriptional regulator with XRE-family HTH domain